ncbi:MULTISPECIES: helix-turn-helix domain-containing protein [Colwellia]|uniref:Transcriptional regulator, AraC family n=1 Tax=Colwellia psychrerythraea (strain 34H / ATCC BAA-681) TaxID=167879 RepID=Q47ZT7_COLP3|nr:MULTISPECIES: helix-turn-helix domain-containing protein [Colwellia]AAZ26581.1 transcriptional regulator, AraC family [Colwellia psychrerythraea 34H]PKH87310.1 AraC family transcriptional regulator [Colwellia sp. Bg11-28]
MDLQKTIHSDKKIRGMSTSDIDELALFQENKNRRYTQLYTGQLQGDYLEINLGKLQVFRENLNVGALIEATPAKNFVPFAALLSNRNDTTFCGKHIEQNAILQATGGDWDVNFKNHLNVIAAVFDRDTFSHDIHMLTGQEIPNDWLISKACLTDPLALTQYATGVNNIINVIKAKPEVIKTENSLRMINDTILRLAYNVLKVTTPCTEKRVNQSKRCEGVRHVMDYLHHYGQNIPTIPELCKVAKLSERNLQYGFKEYLGVTPIRYLRLLRLNGVRRDLLVNRGKKDKIVDVALDWGFIELGRFASEYRQLFQELPSATLKRLKLEN